MALKITRKIQKLFSGFNEVERPQFIMAMTEDGRLVDMILPVSKGCCIREPSMEAWEIDSENQVKASPKGTVRLLQLVSERDYRPIPLWTPRPKNRTDDERTLSRIAESITDQTLSRGQRKANKDTQGQIILTIICVLAVIIICIIIKSGFETGHFMNPFQHIFGGG